MINTSTVGFERERNLPPFGHTAVAMRMSLLIPVIMSLLAGFEGHISFEALRHGHHSSYSPISHVGFIVLTSAPGIGLLMTRMICK